MSSCLGVSNSSSDARMVFQGIVGVVAFIAAVVCVFALACLADNAVHNLFHSGGGLKEWVVHVYEHMALYSGMTAIGGTLLFVLSYCCCSEDQAKHQNFSVHDQQQRELRDWRKSS